MIEANFREDKLNEYIFKAIAVHLGILMLAYVSNIIFDLNLFNLKPDENDIKVVQSSVRVDVVGLPKHTLQELKKMETHVKETKVEVAKPSKSNETSEVEFKTKKKKVNLSNLLKNLSSSQVKEKAKAKPKDNKIDKRALKKLILEGNKVSQGSSITGEELIESQKEFVRYIQALPDKVRPNWKLPTYLIEKNLRCRIRIFIASDGKVVKTEILESSGDEEYDQKALSAIKQSSPLPKPSSNILKEVTSGQVVLGFPL
ncbi:MAG: TonB family protein [Bacteriovoracaceae bacterium]|jgi:TonB family protein|nr:hypothetical protein [Halobacteriovoraceae bacterium]MDP7320278.1 TonB family protein [Bacteriovoracaceae bacterium]